MLFRSGRFTTDLLLELIIGKPLMEAIDMVSGKYPQVDNIIKRLSTLMNEDTNTVIKDIGQSCSSQFAFPAAMYLIMKYRDHFQEALKHNVLAGGDSAGRGMIIGMVLGASLGYSHLPQELVKGLTSYEIIHGFTQRKLI